MRLSYKIEQIICRSGLQIKELRYEQKDLTGSDLAFLKPDERSALDRFGAVKRKLEYYFTRVLWQTFDTGLTILYDDRGRPYTQNGHISISHSRNTVVIAFENDHPVGVDIEFFSPKIRLIQHKFIRTQDEDLLDISDDISLTIAWSIKEAIYKMEDIPFLSFKDHIHVSVNRPGHCGKADVIKDGAIHHYDFNFVLRADHVITYCTIGHLAGKTNF